MIDCKGELEFESCALLNQVLTALVDKKIYHVVINCTQIENIDSSGIGLFLSFAKKLKLNNGGLFITGLNPHLTKVFRIVRADKLIRIIKDRDKAFEEATDFWVNSNENQENPKTFFDDSQKLKLVSNELRLLLTKSHKIILNYNLITAPPVEKTNVLHVSKDEIIVMANPKFMPPVGTFMHAMLSTPDDLLAYHFTSTVIMSDENRVVVEFPDFITEVKEEHYYKISKKAPVKFCSIDSLKNNRIFEGNILMISGGAIVAEVPRDADFLGLLGLSFTINDYPIETCIGRVVNIKKLNPEINIEYNIIVTVAFLTIDRLERDIIIKHIFAERKGNK